MDSDEREITNYLKVGDAGLWRPVKSRAAPAANGASRMNPSGLIPC